MGSEAVNGGLNNKIYGNKSEKLLQLWFIIRKYDNPSHNILEADG